VHSLAELHLYAAMAVCRACSTLGLPITQTLAEAGDAALVVRAKAACEGCGEESVFAFIAARDFDTRPEAACRLPVIINTTADPSELLDVSQWLTLYRIAVDAAEKLPAKPLARAVLIEAGQCLAEALRFYPPDSDVPSASAFFGAETLQRFRDHPHLFARQRLIELAGGLPVSLVNPPVPVDIDRPNETKWWLR
jgi:hypothetical protein